MYIHILLYIIYCEYYVYIIQFVVQKSILSTNSNILALEGM